MGRGGNGHFFPLTSLQIGDMQSYLSTLTLFLAPESNKLFVLVDNRPWLIDQDKPTAYLWQLMVNKSRLSPFANTRSKRERKVSGRKLDYTNSPSSSPIKPRRLHRWFMLIDAATCQKRVLLPVKKFKESFLLNKELRHILCGFIVFEVAWSDVRGINYINELQTDTSMALEVKRMKRWEFDSIDQASNFISLWFSGTSYEHFILQNYLDEIGNIGEVYYDALEDIASRGRGARENVVDFEKDKEDEFSNYWCRDSTSSHVMNNTSEHLYSPPVCGPYKRRKIYKKTAEFDEIDEVYGEYVCSPSFSVQPHSPDRDCLGLSFEPTLYNDALIIFKFNDHDLPFKLKDIIMPDLRLLTLLEYGLPSWVIFFQSYPLFCQIYRPWMCPLARALYVIISVVTVVIGFYDLYKNVPLLKATASRLLGPFFDWIESWEMISRLKYLGTMLFLHNFEKAVKWILMVTRAGRSILSMLTKPVSGPLVDLFEFFIPTWNILIETIEWLSSVVWVLFESLCSVVFTMLQMMLWPMLLLCCTLWNIATYVIYPILWTFWEIFTAPIRLIFAMINFLVIVSSTFYNLMVDAWLALNSIFQFGPASQAAAVASEASIWRSLWNDLFSQVFRALRSILYGFVAFLRPSIGIV
ncbi:hypothetical protein HPP92_010625 [Vanilla planifolia]|uniref:Uncharacterized protein n=1 Tax=Vanilla planifolia TaxID=51239 RepID=A0A835QZ90_VANPL|nr:hypothetical protein HPP92_010625 [Vanilla planifolia]